LRIKRTALDTESELWKKVHPVILHIYCRGVLDSSSKRLVGSAILNLVSLPIPIVISIVRRFVHLLILLVVWWFLRDELAGYDPLLAVGLIVALIAIFYKDIYELVIYILISLLIFVTGGRFWKWMCAGYASGIGFRQKLFVNKHMEEVVATMSQEQPREYQNQYDRILNLYLESGRQDNEEEIDALIEEYWQTV